MTPSPSPSITSRVLDWLFGKRLEGEERVRLDEERPPKPVRVAFLVAFAVVIVAAVLSLTDKRGWADVWPDGLPHFGLLWIAVALTWAYSGVHSHYRLRTRRERDRKRLIAERGTE